MAAAYRLQEHREARLDVHPPVSRCRSDWVRRACSVASLPNIAPPSLTIGIGVKQRGHDLR
jgi:hypothetical protein